MEFDLTQKIYDEFAAKAIWQQTPIGLLKKQYNLKMNHKEICQLLLEKGIILTKQDQTYYQRHSDAGWLKEWKQKCSKGHEEKWASLTEEEKKRLGNNYVQNLFKYRNSLSAEEKTILGNKISDNKMQSRNNMSDKELAQRYQRMSDGWNKKGENARKLRCNKIKQSCWDNLNQEDKLNKCIKISKHLKSKYSYTAEDGISFDSTWEELLYRALVKWGVNFKYTNTDTEKNIMYLNHPLKQTWKPDFILPDFMIILEVKGMPLAKNKFWKKDLPAFLASEYAEKYSVLLVDFPLNPTHLSLDDVLNSAKVCHLISNKNRNKHLEICSTTSINFAWLHSDMQNNKPREFGGDL